MTTKKAAAKKSAKKNAPAKKSGKGQKSKEPGQAPAKIRKILSTKQAWENELAIECSPDESE